MTKLYKVDAKNIEYLIHIQGPIGTISTKRMIKIAGFMRWAGMNDGTIVTEDSVRRSFTQIELEAYGRLRKEDKVDTAIRSGIKYKILIPQ